MPLPTGAPPVVGARAETRMMTTMEQSATIDLEGELAALERARQAVDLGVDAVFVEAPESVAELEHIAASLPGVTLVANMVETGRTPLLTPSELHELGFDLIVSPVTGVFAMARAVGAAFDRLAEAGTLRDDLDQLIAFDAFTDLVGLPDAQAVDARYNL